jgi:hypothetical protein
LNNLSISGDKAMACGRAQEPWVGSGQVVHIRAAPCSDATLVAATVEMWIVDVIHEENPVAEPTLASIQPDRQPKDGSGHMWGTGGWNVRRNE